MSQDLERVAKRLRAWRDEAGLTLQQLAERCGVATSTIQKVETRQMVPTVAVLLKLAQGLGKRPSDFVSETGAEFRVRHTTAANRNVFGDGQDVRVERLVGDLQSPSLEVWRVTHGPGAGLFREGVHFDGECLIVCEVGELHARVDGDEYRLESGDSLHFKADLPHGWENRSASEVQFLIIGSLPDALRAVLDRDPKESNRGDSS